MIHQIFAIYDSKAEAFLQPLFAQNRAVAIRSFAHAAQLENHDFHNFAADFTLFEIGLWDSDTGEITTREPKIALGTALEYINAKLGE